LSDDAFLAAFRLPTKGSGELARKHPMPREDRITFDEATHTYKVDNQTVPRSVTGFLHEYASEFDPKSAVTAMKNGRDWEAKKAALASMGVGAEEDILRMWARSGEVARARGHLLHWQAEQMCNGLEIEEPHSPEFKQARIAYQVLLLDRGYSPYRAESNLFHCGLVLAGQPDLLMTDQRGEIVIVDWKRSKSMKFENAHGSLKYPLEHIPDSNFWLYSLQLNTYRLMLETEYGMPVSDMILAVCHPEIDGPRLIACPRMDEEMRRIVEFEIESGRAHAAALPGPYAPFCLL